MQNAAPAAAPCESVHVAINSLASYGSPRARLLRELAAAGVPMSNVHVFLGDSDATSAAANSRYSDYATGAWFYRVPHNSVDVMRFFASDLVERPTLLKPL